MRKFGMVAAMLVAGLMVSQAFGASTFYLSTTALPPVGQTSPAPGNPDITLDLVNGPTSVTMYLYAQFGASSTSTALAFDFAESNPAIVAGSNVQLVNPDIGDLIVEEEKVADIYRWNGWNQKVGIDGNSVGFAAIGKFDEHETGGYDAVGLTSAYGGTDPTRRGSANPYRYYVGQVTFTAAALGQTDIFLTVNDTLMLGTANMIGTVASPQMTLGGSDATPVPVSWDGTVYYIASGVKSQVADAHITVVPEPATLALLGLAGLVLVRRR